MPVDTSIYNNLLRPPKSIAEYDNEHMAGQANKLALMMGQQKADQYGRAVAQENALMKITRDAFDPVTGKLDAGKYRTGLGRSGNYAGLQKFESDQAALAKTQREAQKEQLAAAKSRVELIGQVAGAAKDPQSYAAGLQMLQQAGVDISNIPQQFDPAYVAQARNQALTASQQLEQVWKQKGYDLDVAQFGYRQQNDSANRSVTMRGQNMTDARGREANALKAQENAQGGKAPAGYRWKQDGSLEAIPGGPGDKAKAPTEFQGKSAGFGARAQAADKIIASIEGKYNPAAINAKQQVEGAWLVGGALGAATNKFALDANDQKAEQAQRDFINAVLRQESGAAIAESEFANAKKQYFPQPGDGKEVIAQKANNRKMAIQGFMNSAGAAANGARPAKVDSAPNPFSGWSIQEVK